VFLGKKDWPLAFTSDVIKFYIYLGDTFLYLS
jgi:hypothetical protein